MIERGNDMRKDEYYIIPYEMLPLSIKKVLQVNEFLLEHPDQQVKKVCELYGVSNSAYYKYNNTIRRYKGE